MAYANKAFVRATLGATNATLYTTPTTSAVIHNVVFTNVTASAVNATLSLNGVALFSESPIPAKSTVSFDMRQALSTGQAITGFASVASSLTCHVSGVEVS